MTIKRTKEINSILKALGKLQQVVDYITALERENAHLRRAIGEWQEKTGEKHPTLIGF